MPKTLAYTLTIEFHPVEAGYLAFFPALPGCHSWGASYEEAVRNAEGTLIGYLEALQKNGESIPEGDHPPGEVSLGVFVNLQSTARSGEEDLPSFTREAVTAAIRAHTPAK
jgi:predicted RNase H-like HicB family nuclease